MARPHASPARSSAPTADRARRPRPRGPRLETLDDARLVALCRDGDELAWRTLVHRYQRLVFTVPLRMGLGEDAAEDVFLETFARLVQWVERVEHPERVRAWLVTTARRSSLDRHRRQLAQSRWANLERAEPGDASPETELDRLARVSEQDLVHRALGELERRCRRLLELLYPRAEAPVPSYREVARSLEMPVGSIGPTRARCLHRLLVHFRRLQRPHPRSSTCTRPARS